MLPKDGTRRSKSAELMKVLLNHLLPFALAHGGFQQQLVQTKSAWEQAGVETFHRRAQQRRGDDQVAQAPQFHEEQFGLQGGRAPGIRCVG